MGVILQAGDYKPRRAAIAANIFAIPVRIQTKHKVVINVYIQLNIVDT